MSVNHSIYCSFIQSGENYHGRKGRVSVRIYYNQRILKRIIFLGFLVKIVVNRPLFIEVIGSFQAGPGLFLGGICRNLAEVSEADSEEASVGRIRSFCVLAFDSQQFFQGNGQGL